ncbi:MAG: DUF2520 domain-containing protein [Xanthomonadales bacterium]|jgi:predicted short-subunit dehydrogenase-like oxidoreductase (DUF2520 family)|nr:DUF2520 domain-containing protein [Xanthomonadales bacterium]
MTNRPTGGPLPTLNVIGCGRAAGSLVRLWLQAPTLRVGAILNRSRSSSQQAVRQLGAGAAAESVGDMPAADLWLIGSGDDQVLSVARALAAARTDLDGALVFHLAGRFGLEVLAPLAEQGAEPAAMHPVRSLTHARLSIADFKGTACVAEGSPAALDRLQPLVTAIGGLWLPVSDIDRGLYHAAVSIVSNVTKGVAWKAQNWLTRAGLPDATATAVTHQLLATTLEDLFRSGAQQSITGPVVRGDTRTVEAHLEALRSSYPDDIDVYRILARTVLELAQERGDLDAATLARFDTLLKG